jgi:hypothetical protein
VIHQPECGVVFYAYCTCGVCGPIRRSRDAANADDRAHVEICSEKKT